MSDPVQVSGFTDALASLCDQRLVQSMYTTLSTSFENVGIWIEKPPTGVERMTYVLSGSNGPRFPDRISSVEGADRTWFNIADFVSDQAGENDAPLLTDDFAPVERLLADLLTTRLGN